MIRLIKKTEPAPVKNHEVDKLDEKEIRRQAQELARAWKVKPNARFRTNR